MRDTWNPTQYDRFKDERSKPFFDLMELVRPQESMRIVDLGCGTGKLTQQLHLRLTARDTLGIDNSQGMLAEAWALDPQPGLRFEEADLAAFAPADTFDLIFSNAAIHWVPDHPALLARFAAMLNPHGQIAIQMPANFDHPTHAVASEVAAREPYRSAMGGHVRKVPVLGPEAYSTLLHRLGFVEQHVRLQVYAHLLGSRDDCVEWVRGTLLTDYQKRMPAEVFERFLGDYRAALLARLPDERPFLYPFKRILFWGRK